MTPIRDDISDPLRGWLDSASPAQRSETFSFLDKASTNTSFSAAVQAATHLIKTLIASKSGTTLNFTNLDMLARRIHEDKDIPTSQANLRVYDNLIARRPLPATGDTQ